jgi:dihydrofolate reductase
MRKVVSYLLASVDGVIEAPEEFVFDHFDDEMMGYLAALIAEQDAVLLGRRTYEMWADYWPTSTHEPFASFINTTPKYVASTTLDELRWAGSTLLDGAVADRVAELKAEPGADIGVHGSGTLVRYLLERGQLDELRLAVFPTVRGRGDRLLAGLDQAYRLELRELRQTARGVTLLTYRVPTAEG